LKWAPSSDPRIVHAKVLTEQRRLDLNGHPRSRGRGFVEFDNYADAVACLRCLNNHPNAGFGFTFQARPIVEFAVEDGRVVAKRQRMMRDKEMRLSSKRSFARRKSLWEKVAHQPENLFDEMDEVDD